jgi:hypothetical protein
MMSTGAIGSILDGVVSLLYPPQLPNGDRPVITIDTSNTSDNDGKNSPTSDQQHQQHEQLSQRLVARTLRFHFGDLAVTTTKLYQHFSPLSSSSSLGKPSTLTIPNELLSTTTTTATSMHQSHNNGMTGPPTHVVPMSSLSRLSLHNSPMRSQKTLLSSPSTSPSSASSSQSGEWSQLAASSLRLGREVIFISKRNTSSLEYHYNGYSEIVSVLMLSTKYFLSTSRLEALCATFGRMRHAPHHDDNHRIGSLSSNWLPIVTSESQQHEHILKYINATYLYAIFK